MENKLHDSSSDFSESLINENKKEITLLDSPIISARYVILSKNIKDKEHFKAKTFGIAQKCISLVEAKKGDEVLDYPSHKDLNYEYPDFSIAPQLERYMRIVKHLDYNIKQALATPCKSKISLPWFKPNLIIESNNLLSLALTPGLHTSLPSFTIIGEDTNIINLVLRPYAAKFLEVLSNYYNIVLYTCTQKGTAKPITELLDSSGDIFMDKLYKESCLELVTGLYVKDLRKFGRLEKVVMLDTSMTSFCLQPSNGILVKPFSGDENDNSLLPLMSFLIEIKDNTDLRVPLRTKFNIEL